MTSTSTFSGKTFPDKTPSDETCPHSLAEARSVLARADRLLLGIGSGVSASGGLDYAAPDLVERWYPEYRAQGLRTIFDIQARYWRVEQCGPEAYWGFWARHIQHVRYEPQALEPYRLLRQLSREKDVFVCTTNVDGQLGKAGFPRERIFAPQGDYALFQCSRPCSQDLYDNRDIVRRMIRRMPDSRHVRSEDVPLCPRCGAYLLPNLRCDHTFVEAPHLKNLAAYSHAANDAGVRRLVLLELGVGYNTPSIIRFPFEDLVRNQGHGRRVFLIRVNLEDAAVPADVTHAGLSFGCDISRWLRRMLEK